MPRPLSEPPVRVDAPMSAAVGAQADRNDFGGISRHRTRRTIAPSCTKPAAVLAALHLAQGGRRVGAEDVQGGVVAGAAEARCTACRIAFAPDANLGMARHHL